jgi:hypothetical protein
MPNRSRTPFLAALALAAVALPIAHAQAPGAVEKQSRTSEPLSLDSVR